MSFITHEQPLIHEAAVFVTHGGYQIIFNTVDKGLAWVKVGDKTYVDANNGNINSEKKVHKIFVPKDVLDDACEYTIIFKRCIMRKPYFPVTGDGFEKTYKFRPLNKKDDINIYMLCDTHSRTKEPAEAAKYFGDKLDALFFNGDIPTHSGTEEHIHSIFYIAGEATKGEAPIIYARGNHDTRGELAIDLPDYIATHNGNLYYTFRIGSIWGVVLDAGEDKNDDHPEYGGMAAFDDYRDQQTKFLQEIIANKEKEYAAEDVKYKICLMHVRIDLHSNDEYFAKHYREWQKSLNEIGIDLMLNGHEHRRKFLPKGRETGLGVVEYDTVIGHTFERRSEPDGTQIKNMHGTALNFNDNKITAIFTDNSFETLEEYVIDIDK